MLDYERDTIQMMRDGQNKHEALVSTDTRRAVEKNHPHLSESQRAAVEQILTSRDQVTALEGVAGAGKTTSLSAVRQAAEREGYVVEGFAPTSRAAQKLAEAGIESGTLQRHLAQGEDQNDGHKRLYVSGRIELGKHEANERIPASTQGHRPRLASRRYTPAPGRGSRDTIPAVTGSGNPDGTA